MASLTGFITFALCIIHACKADYSFSCGSMPEANQFDLCLCSYGVNGKVIVTCRKSTFLRSIPHFPTKLNMMIGIIDMTGTVFCNDAVPQLPVVCSAISTG